MTETKDELDTLHQHQVWGVWQKTRGESLGEESDEEKETVTSSQVETRRSPRKHKRKASISPKYSSKRKKITLLSNDSEKIINEKKETDIRLEKDGVKSIAKQTLTPKPKEKEKGKSEVKPTETQIDKSNTESNVPSKKQEENLNKKSTISKSEFFVFQCMMPFGEFDE